MKFIRLILIFAAAQTAIAAGVNFAILGDRTGNAVEGVYEQICKEIGKQHPDFVINVGDTIQGLDDGTAVAQWDEVRPVWKAFGGVPFYLTPGNHDIWSEGSERIWRKQAGHAPQYGFDFQGIHVTVLDNSRSEGLGPEQIRFLEADLAAHAAQPVKFIFLHRPSWLFPIKFQNGNFPLHRIAKKYNAGFIVSGHVHEFDRSEYDGIEYVMVGSSGGSLTHGKSGSPGNNGLDGLYFGYAWVHVEGGTAKLEFRRVEAQSGRGK